MSMLLIPAVFGVLTLLVFAVITGAATKPGDERPNRKRPRVRDDFGHQSFSPLV